MQSDVFYWVLNLSIHGSLVCLLLMMLRLIRTIPRRVIYALWIGPALRLTVPFAPAVPWSFMALLKRLGARTVTLPGARSLEISATVFFLTTERSGSGQTTRSWISMTGSLT